MKRMLVTGSSGLIGSEVCAYFHGQGWLIHGVDNNTRATFFGPQGDTRWNQHRLQAELKTFNTTSWIFVIAKVPWLLFRS